MMRSVVCTAFGEPETLTMADRPEPVAGAGELCADERGGSSSRRERSRSVKRCMTRSF